MQISSVSVSVQAVQDVQQSKQAWLGPPAVQLGVSRMTEKIGGGGACVLKLCREMPEKTMSDGRIWKSEKPRREGEENPLLFFQSGGVILLTWWFILCPLSSFMSQFSTPPHTHMHLLNFFHSFLFSFLWAACEHSYLEMSTEAHRATAALWKWLTCKAARFSSRLATAGHSFSPSLLRETCFCLRRDIRVLLF